RPRVPVVPALVRDPRRAVLVVPAQTTHHGAAHRRCARGARGVCREHRRDALGIRERERWRPHLAAGARDPAGVRRIPRDPRAGDSAARTPAAPIALSRRGGSRTAELARLKQGGKTGTAEQAPLYGERETSHILRSFRRAELARLKQGGKVGAAEQAPLYGERETSHIRRSFRRAELARLGGAEKRKQS